jgi:(1->4)-alpha-D-glucan 1-alpha-D-glucosylmutase
MKGDVHGDVNGAWTATYRLQVHAGFSLPAAEQTLDYLAALGVSHVYLSPCLQAAPGSAHGYDVTNPTKISDDLGGEAAWRSFVAAAHARRLKILLDVVPNHMATSETNPWWDDVLAHGPFSDYAGFFDFRCAGRRRWRAQLSILGRPYGDALQAGEIKVEIRDARPRIRHFDHSLPLGPASWAALLDDQGGDPAFSRLEELLYATPDTSSMSEYRCQIGRAEKRLREAACRGVLPAAVERVNADPDRLDAVLERQFYSLHGWKLAGELTNYRRFFDVGTLVGMRTELPQVFDAMHGRVARMIADGDVDGLRVDHPDGLRDPLGYFARLRNMLPDGRIYAEKILENEEKLNADWPIDGSVGYDFLSKVNRLWMDDQRTDALTATYFDFTGHSVNFAALVREKKRGILESTFAADLERLTDSALAVAESRWQTRDLSRRQLREGLARLTTALPVYRTYRTAHSLHDETRRLLSDTIQNALMNSPDIERAVFDFLLALLTRDDLSPAEDTFVESWQQLAPAVMAKGVEDTTFYCFDRLVSCNEVGAQASLIGISAEKFHEFCHHLSDHWPNSLLTTSTHDNKRSEDVRTRISVLSEIPERWGEALHQWSQLNAPAWQNRSPDRHAEYLLYQTLIGAWPIDRERCWQYMQKACREAKIATSWHEPNAAYEQSIRGFIDGLYDSPEFVASLERFIEPLIMPGRINSLAQTLIKMVGPGVPDFYQGTELWDLSLVDPDNRRPVDFVHRAALLESCGDLDAAAAIADWQSGLPKLWMVAAILKLRRKRYRDFQGQTRYQPLAATGAHLGRLLGYQRGDDVIVVVPRFTLTLEGRWGDTRLALPEGAWTNHFTRTPLRGEVAPEALFGNFPVALLLRDVA